MKTIDKKFNGIRDFCLANSNSENVKKYSRYFKEGFDGYGIEQKIFESQRDKLLFEWKDEMTIGDYLLLGEKLVSTGKFEEASFAIQFIAAQKKEFSPEIFDAVGRWLEIGLSNWASTDVLCMLVLSEMLKKKTIDIESFREWTKSDSEWKKRAVPVSLIYALKTGTAHERLFSIIEPLMLDKSIYVQKGLGWFLREAWKKEQEITEKFLLKWKDYCGKTIIQYATEKMDKERKEIFKKVKK